MSVALLQYFHYRIVAALLSDRFYCVSRADSVEADIYIRSVVGLHPDRDVTCFDGALHELSDGSSSVCLGAVPVEIPELDHGLLPVEANGHHRTEQGGW